MLDQLGLSPELSAALIGGITGSVLFVLVTLATLAGAAIHRERARRRFYKDLTNLNAHIVATLTSHDIAPDAPKHFIVARLKFGKVLDGMHSISQLDGLAHGRDFARVLPFLLEIRNSDILLDEIANRVDEMTEPQIAVALEDAKENMRILAKRVARHGFLQAPAPATPPPPSASTEPQP